MEAEVKEPPGVGASLTTRDFQASLRSETLSYREGLTEEENYILSKTVTYTRKEIVAKN